MLAQLLDLNRSANQLFKSQHIDSSLRGVLKACRDSYVHSDAKELVPLGQLVQDHLDILDDEVNYLDNLLPLVVDWFKVQFFSWFQAPNCEKCSLELKPRGTNVNLEKKLVEHYHCDREECDYKFEFIRHNDPAILLRTRTGRCGEWAMCFLIILRSLDYDARIVYDSTDHVWNEVWSEPKQRWIHVDPCEGVVDEPLIYETGWQKKLEYCLAMSQYEVIDVTRRYTVDYNATKRKRNRCDEAWLKNVLDETTENLMKSVPSDEIRARIRDRRLKDIEYMENLAKRPRTIPDKNRLGGRKTGSIQWRIQRGEYVVSHKSRHIIRVKPRESQSVDQAAFSLRYNCDKNQYESSDAGCNLRGWSSLVYEYENLDFKYEKDWKTSYVARYETCPPSNVGKVRWRLDLTDLEGNWQRFELLIRGKEYPNTSIRLELSSYETCDSEALETRPIHLNVPLTIRRDQLKLNTRIVDVLVMLSGGDEQDAVAWQKPQLFRQTRGQNEHESSLSLEFFKTYNESEQ